MNFFTNQAAKFLVGYELALYRKQHGRLPWEPA